MTTQILSGLYTAPPNESIPEGCAVVRFSEWEYLPWNNSDNLVGQHVQLYAAQVRTNLLQILFLIGGPANVINMAVFFKQGVKDRVNLLLFSLSLADELYLIGAMLHCAQDFYFQFTKETEMTPFYIFVMNNNIIGLYGFCYVSFVLSAVVACERCYCVLRPLQYQATVRTKPLAVFIVAVYVVVAGLQFLVVSRYHVRCAYDPDTGAKFNMFLHSEFYKHHKDLIDYIDNIIFGAGLQIVMPIVVVTPTVITIWKLREAMAWRTESASSVSAKEVALTKMLVGTSVLLIVCVSPNCVLRVACLFEPELNTGRRHENLFLTGIWMSQTFAYINSSFNIFIYYMMGSRYRETFWALFHRKAKHRRNGK